MCQSINEGQEWQNQARESLSGDEPTIELVLKAKRGNRPAVDALMRRCLPPLRRWAHGKLPAHARGQLDTCDLVQDVALHTLGRLQSFEVRHAYGMRAYLRQAVMNRIRTELRSRARRPRAVAVPDDLRSNRPSPLAVAIEMEEYWRYRRALSRLGLKDRQLVFARIERGWSHKTIAARLRLPSVPAANMAVSRAVKRLAHHVAG